MSNIFLSYSSEDRPQAEALSRAFQAQGWSVWWDRTIATGVNFHRAIQDAVDTARCIVVLWSTNSIESDWVLAEADEGLRRQVLIPVSLDDAIPPLRFRQLQTADLAHWNGASTSPTLKTLFDDIFNLLGSSSADAEGKILDQKAEWHVELRASDPDTRELKVQLTHEHHTVGHRYSQWALNNTHKVFVDGTKVVSGGHLFSIYTVLRFYLTDGDEKYAAKIDALQLSGKLKKVWLTVHGRLLYKEGETHPSKWREDDEN